jgi:hypothetical protein
LKIFNHTTNELELSLVDPNNTILNFPSGNYYFVGSFSKRNDITTIFFSADFEIDGQVLKFNYDTNTYSFLDLIKGDNVQIGIEIGYKDEAGEHVILQDIAIASQRYYIDGMPTPKDVSQYYTKFQTEEAIDKATSGLASIEYVDDAISVATSGFVDKTYVDEQDEALSGAIDGLSSSKQDVIDEEHKLDYDLLSGTPTIPTKVSELDNDSGYQTSSDVQTAISGKADKSELEAYQLKITSEAKLGYGLLSGTPSIPTKTSDLQNDSDFATSAYVDASVSGKADKSELEDYQKLITSTSKLDYALLSGTPTIPLSTSQLTNDSNFATSAYVQQETSGKLDKADYIEAYNLPTNAGAAASWLGATSADWTDTSIIANDKKIEIITWTDEAYLNFPTLSTSADETNVRTVEVWVKMAGNEATGISNIYVPNVCSIVDADNFPANLKGEDSSKSFTYHIFVMRFIPKAAATYAELAYSHAFNTNGNY